MLLFLICAILQLHLHLKDGRQSVEALLLSNIVAKEDSVGVGYHFFFQSCMADVLNGQVYNTINAIAWIYHVHFLLICVHNGRLVVI